MRGVESRFLGAVPARSAECEALITRVAALIEAQTDTIAQRLIDRVTVEMAFDPRDLEVHDALLAAARGSVALVTVMARSWTDPRIVPPPRDALLWARTLVARNLPPEALLRVYRIGQSGYQEVWIHELAESGAEASVVIEAIGAVSAFVFTWVDAISTPLLDAYNEELARRVSGVQAMRAETIALALSGQPFDVAAASARLRYDLARDHVALIAWVEPDASDHERDGLESGAESAAATLGGSDRTPLIHRDGPGVVFAWAPTWRLDPDLVTHLTAVVHGTGVHVAVGAPGRGAAGFRESHDGARRARRVARLLRPDTALTLFSEVAILDLLTQDLPAARALASVALGPLAQSDDRARRLLATLRIFFQEGQSFARTARRLNIHENTIADRIRRALQLSDHDAADLYALRTAVELAPLLQVPDTSARI